VNGEANRVMWPRVSTASGVHREPRGRQINRAVSFILDHGTTNSLVFHVYSDKRRLNMKLHRDQRINIYADTRRLIRSSVRSTLNDGDHLAVSVKGDHNVAEEWITPARDRRVSIDGVRGKVHSQHINIGWRCRPTVLNSRHAELATISNRQDEILAAKSEGNTPKNNRKRRWFGMTVNKVTARVFIVVSRWIELLVVCSGNVGR
jgi:hypothetical protein